MRPVAILLIGHFNSCIGFLKYNSVTINRLINLDKIHIIINGIMIAP